MSTADSEYVISIFQAAINAKTEIAKNLSLVSVATNAIDKIHEVVSRGGVVRIFSDAQSRWYAHHLNEELVVRYKAGAQFGRKDRPAINARQYSDIDYGYILRLIDSDRFDSKKDICIIFSSRDEDKKLLKLAQALKGKKFPIIIIANCCDKELLSCASFALELPKTSRSTICSLMNMFLHVVCERLEPEFSSSEHSLDKIAMLSSSLDNLCIADSNLLSKIIVASQEITKRTNKGASIFLAGNGGSTCDINALVNYLREPSVLAEPIDIFDLHSADTLLCAYNDNHLPFERQIEANAESGDVFIVYSTSGNSPNLIEAVNLAKSKNVFVIGLLGKGGGKLALICDVSIVVPSNETARVQETHALIGPMLFGL